MQFSTAENISLILKAKLLKTECHCISDLLQRGLETQIGRSLLVRLIIHRGTEQGVQEDA